MRVALRLVLAAGFLIAAILLPGDRIDGRRASRVAERERAVAESAAELTPGDDTYVDRVTRPYPVRASSLLRLFLITDALLLVCGPALWRVLGRPAIAARAPITAPRAARVSDWWHEERWTVLALTALGAALRIVNANRDLWLDEILTLTRRVAQPLLDTLIQAIAPNNHLLYSVLSRASVAAFGESAWALRLPAMLFGIATIPVLYALVRRYSGMREAVLATLALTVSYHHVFFSQNARGYAGFLFGGLLATLALRETLDRDSASAWLLYMCAMVVSVASVVIGASLLAAHLIAVTVFRPARRAYLMLGLTGYLIAHLYAPIIPDVFRFVDTYQRPDLGFRFSGELVRVVLRDLQLGPAAAAIVVAGAAIAGIGAVSYWRQDRLYTSLVLLPLILMAVFFVGMGAAVYPRLFIFALPVGIILAARGVMTIVDRLPTPALRHGGFATAIAGLAVVSVFMLRTWWRFPMQDYRGARRFVEERMGTGDAVAAVGLAQIGYRYYWPGIIMTDRVTAIDALAARHKRVWLLYTLPTDIQRKRPRLWRSIREQCRPERSFRGMVGDGAIRVCIRDGPAS